MRASQRIFILVAAGLLAFLAPDGTRAADAGAMQPQPGWYTDIVDLDFVKPYAVIPKRDDVAIIDARPVSRKYDPGHIPTAISMPNSRFDKLTDLLPEDKSTLIIFYCEGPTCMLSHKSAYKAEALGYTNIKVYAGGYPDWIEKGNIGEVSAAYVKKLIDKKADAVIIDSRPKKRRYDVGHVPTAISIPDSQFDKLTDLLPTNKDTQLIFYCGGYACKLSPKSAARAVALGYTDAKIFQAGYPAWVEAYGEGETVVAEASKAKMKPASAVVETGDEPDTITVQSFEKILSENPDSIRVIDVRDPDEFAAGALKPAVNIPVGELEDQLAELTGDKPIVFVCSTGARSGEAFDIVKMEREDLPVYFLDATITYKKDGTYKIDGHDG